MPPGWRIRAYVWALLLVHIMLALGSPKSEEVEKVRRSRSLQHLPLTSSPLSYYVGLLSDLIRHCLPLDDGEGIEHPIPAHIG